MARHGAKTKKPSEAGDKKKKGEETPKAAPAQANSAQQPQSAYVAGSIFSSIFASAGTEGKGKGKKASPAADVDDAGLGAVFVDAKPKEIAVQRAVVVQRLARPQKSSRDEFDPSDEDTEDDDVETGISKRLTHGSKRKADGDDIEREVKHTKRSRGGEFGGDADGDADMHPLTRKPGRDRRQLDAEDEAEELGDIAARTGKSKKKAKKATAKTVAAATTENGAASAGGDGAPASAEAQKLHRDSKEDDPDRLARTLFVGNLPVDTAKHPKPFKKLVSQFGAVESVRFRSVALEMPGSSANRKAGLLGGKLHPDRDSMNAYVVYETKEAANAALALGGTEFSGKHLRVDNAGTPRTPDTTKSVFVGNLPFNAEDEQLYRAFAPCGRVTSVRIIRDAATNIGKGFGYVEFAERGAVAMALTMHGTKDETLGRELRVFKARKDAATGNKFRGEVAKKGTSGAVHRLLKAKRVGGAQKKSHLSPSAPKKVKSGGVTKKRTKVRSMDKAHRDRTGAAKLAARAGKGKAPKGAK